MTTEAIQPTRLPTRRPPKGAALQVTRIPPFHPGRWVKVKHLALHLPGSDLSERVLEVRSLTCSITSPEQTKATWRCHFRDGRCLEVENIARLATPAEVQTAQARAGR